MKITITNKCKGVKKIRPAFILAILLIGLIALGAVGASDNQTTDNQDSVITAAENTELAQNIDDSMESAGEDSNLPQTDSYALSNHNEVDLTIYGYLREYNYHKNAELIIGVYNYNGISHNTKVNIKISDGLKFVSYDANKGTYNSKTGIWNIGDLDDSKSATLNIQFQVEKYKKYTVKLRATTDSVDTDASNNYYTESIIISEPQPSYVITGDEDLNHNKHRSHYRSSASGLVSRSVSKSVNISEPEAASVEKPTANPIIALLTSVALIGITTRRKH